MTIVYVLIVCLILYMVFKAVAKRGKTSDIHGHWQHYFEDAQFSSQDIYARIERILAAKGIPAAKASRVNHSETGLFSANREYLRIARNYNAFDVCAAPFGKGFFISSWHVALENPTQNVLSHLPVIGKTIAQGMEGKTYFQIDTEQMYVSAVHNCILEAIDEITTSAGMRTLSETERVFQSRPATQ